jgi:hypothetical protein
MKGIFICFALLILFTTYLLPQKVGSAYRLHINNINLPFNTNGTIADVNIPPDGTLGRFNGIGFLYSSGFMISGYTNGVLWACAQATASRVNNFIPGRSIPIAGDDDQMYVLSKNDQPFGQSWQDWIDAVTLGADFYDGDGDGIYNPVDLNGNNQWDPDEDAPDLLGDVTAWCLFNDGVPALQRERFPGIDPQGIEIRQTIFAYASVGALGNIIFLRYRISNSGLLAQSLDSVYFSVWADPDLGDHLDDLVGVDTLRNAGFTNNDGDDNEFGSNPPSFMIDFFSGPRAYIPGETFIDIDGDGKYTPGIYTALDTAYSHRGQLLGITEFPGAKNLPVNSFVHYQQSDPILGDPNTHFEARNYMIGRNRLGNILDPCSHHLGEVRGGVDCSAVNPLFWYSGDPVTNVGWINIVPTDQRQLTNTGPFTLKFGEEIEIFVAYLVGQGIDALNSITETRSISDFAQLIYDNNFDIPVSVEDETLNLPTEFSLSQNYPNPFNPSTIIKFSVPTSGYATLKIYNALGEEVVILIDKELTTGTYEVEWNASGLPSGIYFYQLKTEGFIETKKMIFIK